MKCSRQKIPLRVIAGGARSGPAARRSRRCAAGEVLAERGATWLYDLVDRRARETYETLRFRAREGESRCG
jgi:hypothetical protein